METVDRTVAQSQSLSREQAENIAKYTFWKNIIFRRKFHACFLKTMKFASIATIFSKFSRKFSRFQLPTSFFFASQINNARNDDTEEEDDDDCVEEVFEKS